MITEEMLQFIRDGEAAGMEKNEIMRLLLSEGGWDQADLDEAYRALEAPLLERPVVPASLEKEMAPSPASSAPVIASVQAPSGSVVGQASILPGQKEVSAPWQSPPQATPSPLLEKVSPARINLDKILPGTSGGQMLSQIKSSPAGLPRLFSQKTDLPTREASLKEAPVSQPPSNVVPKEPPKEGAKEPSAFSSPHSKTDGSAVERLFTGASAAPVVPASHLSAEPQPESAPPPPPVFASTPKAVSVPPLKFDLAALRSETPIAQDQKVAPAPELSLHASGTPSSSVGAFGHMPDGGAKEKEQRAGTSLSSHDAVFPGEEKKKIIVPTKRTMMSDLLSHETTTAPAPSLPAVSAPADAPLPKPIKEEKSKGEEATELPVSAVATIPVSPFEDDATRRAKRKRMLKIALGALFALLILGGALFLFMKFRAPGSQALLGTASTHFFGVSSFSYKGQATTDLTLSATSGGVVQNGSMKFSLGFNGSLGSGKDGFGDGEHYVALSGGWQWGDSLLSTDITSDLRVVANAIYFRPLSFPERLELDPETFKENWLKVDFFEIAQELQVSGVAPGTEEYGRLGGTSGETVFNALLAKWTPFEAAGSPQAETLGGVATMHIPVVAEPERMANFAQALYRKYFNQDLVLSEDQMVRLRDALAKVSGDVWVDEETGALQKIILSANFDDDLVGVRVEGPVRLELSFADFNKPVVVNVPIAVLSLVDLNAKKDEYKKMKDLRARDQVKIDRVSLLRDALESYQREMGRYPKGLADLYSGGKLATSSIPLVSLNEYFYRSYQQDGAFTKSTQCLVKGKVCAFYHLGTNLEDMANPALTSDADRKTAIVGDDHAGCGGEAKRACYDIVASVVRVESMPPTAVPASTPTISASASSATPKCVRQTTSIEDISLFQVRFVELGGRAGHEGLFPIYGDPIAGEKSAIQTKVFGPIKDVTIELENYSSKEVLQTYATKRESGSSPTFNSENVVVPPMPFSVVACGHDISGKTFFVKNPVNLGPEFSPKTGRIRLDYLVTMPTENGNALPISIKNGGVKHTFKIQVENPEKYVRLSYDDQPFTLQANEQKTINVTGVASGEIPQFETIVLNVQLIDTSNGSIANTAKIEIIR